MNREYTLEEFNSVDPENFEIEDIFTSYEIEKQLKNYGFQTSKNNSIRYTDVYNRLIENMNRIPIGEIENLLDKYNCI